VRVVVDEPAARAALTALDHGADQVDLEPVLDARITVVHDHGGYLVTDGGDELARPATAAAVADEVHARVHRRAFEFAALQGWVRVHGVLATVGDRRVLVSGPSGSGKTTLALGLLAEGRPVDGDESVIIRDGQARAVPRRFHVKAGRVAVPSVAAAWLEAAPPVGDAPGLRALDPRVAGLPWRTRVGPIDDLVLLERTDGPSRAEDGSTPLALERLRREVFRTAESRATVVRQLAAALRGAHVHRLWSGPDARAPAALIEKLGRGPRGE